MTFKESKHTDSKVMTENKEDKVTEQIKQFNDLGHMYPAYVIRQFI